MEHTLRWIDRINLRLGRAAQHTPAHQRGLLGERAAYFYLRRLGYIVVARRWRSAHLDGEVDLIAWEGETLTFVEVKTRGARTPFAAEFSIDRAKADTLRRMADAYVAQMPWRTGQLPALSIRFDAVSVYVQEDGRNDVRLLRDFFR